MPPGDSSSYEARLRRQGYHAIAGVDEAGRGAWAGPVVASAVLLGSSDFSCRVDDSKLLTPRARERAYRDILKQGQVRVGLLTADQIDARNILRATLQAMQEAVAGLDPAPEIVLIDGLHAPRLGIRVVTLIHGEAQSLAIAAASIVAKVTRDRLMRFYHRLFPQYGFDEHKGYGTALHLQQLQTHGPSWLHRRSYAPVRRVTSS
ncbi:MAG: ribonuclease HII [Candidatus Omnitrophica bacterium]|nr:ribonuclease HII [Candidatus Omnitrophota bacterium]